MDLLNATKVTALSRTAELDQYIVQCFCTVVERSFFEHSVFYHINV